MRAENGFGRSPLLARSRNCFGSPKTPKTCGHTENLIGFEVKADPHFGHNPEFDDWPQIHDRLEAIQILLDALDEDQRNAVSRLWEDGMADTELLKLLQELDEGWTINEDGDFVQPD